MIDRIQRMEERYDRAREAVTAMRSAVEQYAAAKDDLIALERYISSGEWKQDYEADEQGQLPEGMKRGVLSEDGLWNLLSAYDELRSQLHGLHI